MRIDYSNEAHVTIDGWFDWIGHFDFAKLSRDNISNVALNRLHAAIETQLHQAARAARFHRTRDLQQRRDMAESLVDAWLDHNGVPSIQEIVLFNLQEHIAEANKRVAGKARRKWYRTKHGKTVWCCDWCETEGFWKDDWYAHGSYKHWEDGKGIVTCSSSCRHEAKTKGYLRSVM